MEILEQDVCAQQIQAVWRGHRIRKAFAEEDWETLFGEDLGATDEEYDEDADYSEGED